MYSDAYHATQKLEAELERTRRERDEYQSQVHELTERVNGMTNAASMAAGTAENALGKLLRAQPVVEAAVALADDFEKHVGSEQIQQTKRGASLFTQLLRAVREYHKGGPS